VTTLYDCPECALPATATPRGRWDSTHGPVDHVFVRCVTGHRFFGPVDMLTGHRFFGPVDMLTGHRGGRPPRTPPGS